MPDLHRPPERLNSWLLVALVGASLVFAVVAALLAARSTADVRVAGRTIRLTAAQRSGQRVFARSCASCHALAASDSRAAIGPNLDYVQPSKGQTMWVLDHGLRGANAYMPGGFLPLADAEDVAEYLSVTASRQACCAP